MQLPMLRQDLANHCIYGNAAGLVGAAAAATLGHPELSGWSANAAALAAGIVKELADWLANRAAIAAGLPAPHSVDMDDMLATWMGGLQVQAALAIGAP